MLALFYFEADFKHLGEIRKQINRRIPLNKSLVYTVISLYGGRFYLHFFKLKKAKKHHF